MNLYRSTVTRSNFHSETLAFFEGMTVVVTGGSGFIGSHVVEQLLSLGAKPIVLTRQPMPNFISHLSSEIEVRNCDLFHYEQTLNAIEGANIVLHLAASVAGIEYNLHHPASIFQDNMQTFFNVIKASAVHGVKRFLVTSSACVYPRFCSLPTPEEEGFTGEPEPTNSGYGWSKRMEEYLGQQYAKEFGINVAIARPYNAFGPRDNFEASKSHVIPSLIRKAFLCNNGVLPVWGDGSHSRSFLYVDDFARGLLEVTARYAHASPINIGADEEVTIRDTANLIADIVSNIRNTSIRTAFDPQGLTGQPRRRCDTTKLKSLLNFETKVQFRDGIMNTILWYRDSLLGKSL